MTRLATKSQEVCLWPPNILMQLWTQSECLLISSAKATDKTRHIRSSRQVRIGSKSNTLALGPKLLHEIIVKGNKAARHALKRHFVVQH